MHPVSSLVCLSLDIVDWVGSATHAEAAEDTAADHQEQTQEDVDQGGGPEGKQVECPVAVGIHIGCILVVVRLINRVYPHITLDNRETPENKYIVYLTI